MVFRLHTALTLPYNIALNLKQIYYLVFSGIAALITLYY